MLKDKVTIVTGASRGIGKVIGAGFAREGADAVVAARSDQVQEKWARASFCMASDEELYAWHGLK